MSQGTVVPMLQSFAALREKRTLLAYRALVLFSVLYFFRPEDFIPALTLIPIGKIAGGIALLALVFGTKSKERGRLPIECKLLLLLLVQMLLTIPFAFWRGGSMDIVINKFSKGVIVALLIALVVTTVRELRKLLYIQAAAVALVTVGSLLAHNTVNGRLMGIQKGILENPNDLAINIAINFPLCMAFMFAAKGGLRKSLWAMSLLTMLYAVVATYSRSGMIAMVVTAIICLWEFGVRDGRRILLMSAAIVGVFGLALVLTKPNYLLRLESLVRGNIEGSGDKGSLEARTELLRQSLRLMVHNPVFGVGPGNFKVITGMWQVAHNTYTEVGAETGFPGFILFCAVLISAVRRVRRVRKLPGYADDENLRLWTNGLWASLAAYLAGALFASTEYNLFPYFMVGYICALYRIASKPSDEATPANGSAQDGDMKERGQSSKGEREHAWSR